MSKREHEKGGKRDNDGKFNIMMISQYFDVRREKMRRLCEQKWEEKIYFQQHKN
jgi:hypothetical protein